MSSEHLLLTRHGLTEVDPRARLVVAVALSVAVALAQRPAGLALALAAALLAILMSGLSPGVVLRRLLPLELLVLVLLALLPLTTHGTIGMHVGPLAFSREGLWLGTKIALKSNTIVLALLALVATMDGATLGHALSHFRVPRKLVHLLLFSVRYLDVLQRESRRLRWAMKVRGFRPRMDLHTYRAYGYLVGMLLVRSFDRAERIMAAMKCRGFRGQFHLLDHFAFSRRDMPFCLVSAALLAALAATEWL
ncbi:MAG: cobalt ECF transporter T component CbiQ [Thermoguttaceae bacterium]|jgi:cobalt/nickel transport system permease protein